MSSTYSNLGIELIGTGEQAGTWGVTTNNNFSDIIDNAIVGAATIAVTGTSSGSPTVLTVSNGSSSDGQKRIITASGALGAAGYLQISPNDFAGYYFIRNSTGQTLNVFQGTYSSGNAVAIENGFDAIIKCSGTGAGAVVSFINYKLKTGPLLVTNESTVGTVISGSTSAAALRITQTGSGNALLVEDDANPDYYAGRYQHFRAISYWRYDGSGVYDRWFITNFRFRFSVLLATFCLAGTVRTPPELR